MEGAAAAIVQLVAAGPAALAEMGRRARAAIGRDLSKGLLAQAFCDEIEAALAQARLFTPHADALGAARPVDQRRPAGLPSGSRLPDGTSVGAGGG